MENRLVLIDPTEDLTAKSVLPVNTANSLQVTSQKELEVAGDIVRILKDLQDEVNKVFEPIVKQAHLAHKAAKKAQNDHLQPLQQAEAALRTKINTYIRKVEIDRLAEVAARQKAEENLKQQPALQKALNWDPTTNPRTLSVDVVAPPKLPEVSPPPKAEGMHSAQDWKWEITDVAAIPAEFWILDDSKITDEVRHSKGETNIPGIRVWPESRAVIRR